MLNDVPRTLAYKTAIEKASVWLKDKVYLYCSCIHFEVLFMFI